MNQVSEIIKAMWLSCGKDSAKYHQRITISMWDSNSIVAEGTAEELVNDIHLKDYIIVSITPNYAKTPNNVPIYNLPKIIYVI